MNIKERAIEFAIKVHNGQIRKTNSKPMIYHPLSVGEILNSYGFCDEIIAAGYLHDTVEDTSTTIEDIENIFGPRDARLVGYATQPDKDLPWEFRKNHTIEIVKNKTIEDIAVIIADKIHNIEELTHDIKELGLGVFKYFNVGFESKIWYYESIFNEVSNLDHPMIKKFGFSLKKLIDEINYHISLDNETKQISNPTIILKKTI